jgi:cytochrome c oxidase assembly protein subunit 15
MRHRFSLFTTLLTFIVLVMGVLVVATDAGDACGSDWPKCNGKYLPDFTDLQQVIEYFHRLVTGLLGFVILANSILAWLRKYPGERGVAVLAPLSLFFLFLQAGIGGANVLLGTPPGFTTLDIAVGLALFASLVFLTVALKRENGELITQEAMEKEKRLQRMYRPSLWTVVIIYLEIILGAFFKHSAAAEVLLGIPVQEQLIYSYTLSELIYLLHGASAFFVVIAVSWLIFYSIRLRIMAGAAISLGVLIVLEALVGFVTVLTDLSVPSVSAHMLLASTSIGVGTYITAKARFGTVYIK